MSTEIQKTEHGEIAIQNSGRGLVLTDFESMWRFANAVSKSGFAPKNMSDPTALFVAIEMGQELGLPPMQSVQNIAVINGRPSIWGDSAKGLVEASGLCADFQEWFEGNEKDESLTAICQIHRKGRQMPVRQEFSITDAKRARLWGKDGPWTFYPKRMLQMRARSFAIRDAFPDVMKGLVLAEEAGDFVDVKSRPVSRPQQTQQTEPIADANGHADASRTNRYDDVKAVMDKLEIPREELSAYIHNQFENRSLGDLTDAELARVPGMLWEEWGGSLPEADPQGEPEPETPADNPGPEATVSADPDPSDDGALF